MSDQDFSRIFPGFYICSLASIKRDILDDNQITHVLSILNGFKAKWPKLYTWKVLDLYDMENVNLKQYFDETYEFIENGRKEGSVVVHCFAGISRSASVCIAYMMKKLKISYQDAHDLLLERRDIIYPNDGFKKQLKEYEIQLEKERKEEERILKKQQQQADGANSDTTTSNETTVTTTIVTEQGENSFTMDISKLAIGSKSESEDGEVEYKYCCRKCSKTLFIQTELLAHEVGEGENSFKWGKRDKIAPRTIVADEDNARELEQTLCPCTSFFLTENEWVLNNISSGGNDGKLICDNEKCCEKIGSWSWSGAQCSCGTWVSPSFQIPKSRVDEKHTVQLSQKQIQQQHLLKQQQQQQQQNTNSNVTIIQ